jgi:hypothetical protein
LPQSFKSAFGAINALSSLQFEIGLLWKKRKIEEKELPGLGSLKVLDYIS